ncbi:hypothetical protein TNCV_4987611 [Trichonephila clavipes]|nr:hypothetical protein TNCV_4987611 [Trichonephila clavipes]
MSSQHHIDDFMHGRIIGKIEKGRKITDVARVFDIALFHGCGSHLKLLECVVDGTGEVVFEVRRLQKTDISCRQVVWNVASHSTVDISRTDTFL